MTHPIRPRHRSVAVVTAATATLLVVTACSDGDIDTAPETPKSSAAGSPGGEAPIEVEADGLPADFPRDDVPVVDGEVVSIASPDKGSPSYTVLLNAGEATPAEVVGQAVSALEESGWTAVTEVTGEPPVPQVLTQDGAEATRVILTNRVQDGDTFITYSVTLPA